MEKGSACGLSGTEWPFGLMGGSPFGSAKMAL